MHASRIGLSGPAHPGLLADLYARRVGRDQLPMVREAGQVINERTTNWTAVPCPTRPWAELLWASVGARRPAIAPALELAAWTALFAVAAVRFYRRDEGERFG